MSMPPVIVAYLDAYSRRDVAALVACVSDDLVFENVSNSGQSITTHGRQAFAELAMKAAGMFSSRHQTVRNTVIGADAVALEIDWVGTPAVDIGPMKAGVSIHLRGASFITITNGKLSRIVDLS